VADGKNVRPLAMRAYFSSAAVGSFSGCARKLAYRKSPKHPMPQGMARLFRVQSIHLSSRG
jgi:hypothetical protein